MRARDNPFRTDRVLTIRYRPQGITWDGLMARLAALGHRAAIVGPHGSGKTTLLEDLAPRLTARGLGAKWLRLSLAQRAFPRGFLRQFLAGLGERDVILFDGADLMGRLAWRRVERRSRRAAGLVVTGHRRILLPTLAECSTTPELLEDIARRLLGEAALPWLGDTTRALFARHRGNLRDALRELYDLCARAESIDALAASR